MISKLAELRQMIFSWGKTEWFVFFFLIFLAGFFLSPNLQLHAAFFYLSVFIYLFVFTKKTGFTIVRSKTYLTVLIFSVYFCLSFLWSDHSQRSEDFLYYIRHALSVLVFLLLVCDVSQKNEKMIERLCLVIFVAAALSALFSIFWYYWDEHFSLSPFKISRLKYFGYQCYNSIEGASIYGAAFIIGLMGLTVTKKPCKFYSIYLFSLSVILISVIFTQSRGPILALFVALIVMSFLTKSKKTAVLLFFSVAVALIGLFFSGSIVSEMIERGDGHRLLIYKTGIHEIKQALFFGHGCAVQPDIVDKTGRTYSHLHNLFLATAFHGGLVGLGLLVLIIGSAGLHAIKTFKEEKSGVWLILLLYGCLCSMTDQHEIFNHPDSLWMIFWLPIGIIIGKEVQRKEGS